jgi:hypothetical protein
MISQSFPSYATALESADLAAWCEEASEKSPLSSLFVVLHVDDQDRRYVLQAFDARELARLIQPDLDVFPSGLLQLTLQYPFAVQPMCFGDTARLLHRLSNLQPLGAFLLAEDDKAVCHRTIMPVDEPGLATETLVAAVQVIRHFVVTCADLIEAVAGGEMTYADAMAKVKAGEEQIRVPA